jgi:hypothetical protein
MPAPGFVVMFTKPGGAGPAPQGRDARRPCAILAAAPSATLARLKSHRFELIDPTIARETAPMASLLEGDDF